MTTPTKTLSRILTASALFCLSAGALSAQNYYDDDLYYDPSKAPKKPKTEKKVQQPVNGYVTSDGRFVTTGDANQGLYYYDGASYVPWTSAGDFAPADNSSLPLGSGRDVDEYNRHYNLPDSVVYGRELPDSMSLQQFEDMSATSRLARFDGSAVAQQAMAEYGGANDYNNGYAEGYSSGYSTGYNNAANTSISLNFGVGYPYYYSSWGWPYSSWYWNNYYWNYPSWGWGWDPYWSWSWGPSWSWGWGPSWSWNWGWGWGYPGHYPGWGWGGGWAHVRPNSPSAAHRPRGGTSYGNSYRYNGSTGRGNHYYGSTSSSNRPGYRPPVNANGSTTGGYYGGSTSGRNSHYGTGYTPSGSNSGYRGSSNSGYRPSSSGNSGRGSYGAGQSTRGGSYNSGSSSRSGGYSSGSHSGGGYSGGGRSGGGGSHGGGGGHRSR